VPIPLPVVSEAPVADDEMQRGCCIDGLGDHPVQPVGDDRVSAIAVDDCAGFAEPAEILTLVRADRTAGSK
jgi:hypothetical protein